MILKPSYVLEPSYTHSYKVEIFCHIVLLGDINYFIALFYLFQSNFYSKNYVFQMKQLLKIVLILFDSPPSQRTDKNLFSLVAV